MLLSSMWTGSMKNGIKNTLLVIFWAYGIIANQNLAYAESAEGWYQQAFDKADTKPQEAIHAYLKAIELKPQWAEAHHGLAVIYFQTKDGVRAIDQLRKAELYYRQRTDPQAVKNLVIVRNNLKRAYENLQLSPQDFDQLSGMAEVIGKQQHFAAKVGTEILVRLTGSEDFPGEMSLHIGNKNIKHLCFLGKQGKGLVDKKFLKVLSESGIPAGEYRVASPFADEEWPRSSFSANGVLRLKAVSEPAVSLLEGAEKTGFAIHGRDFYPLLEGKVEKKKMIDFFNRVLFEHLQKHWGPLGISNWDMGRLHDFWKRNTKTPKQWKAKVTAANTQEVRKTCKPPDPKRKLD